MTVYATTSEGKSQSLVRRSYTNRQPVTTPRPNHDGALAVHVASTCVAESGGAQSPLAGALSDLPQPEISRAQIMWLPRAVP